MNLIGATYLRASICWHQHSFCRIRPHFFLLVDLGGGGGISFRVGVVDGKKSSENDQLTGNFLSEHFFNDQLTGHFQGFF